MRNLFLFFLLSLSACSSSFELSKYETRYNKIEDFKEEDATIVAAYMPYKEQLQGEMKTVIGEVENMLTKAQPESTLGNWSADLVVKKTENYTKVSVDFAVLNYGGLRIPSIPKGPIRVEKIFELMPFENTLVQLEMPGSELELLFNHMAAKGGWPISKAIHYRIDNGQAKDILINGAAIDKNKNYQIATINYIANGGDKCSFFKDKKRIETNVLFRDAIIEYIKEETKAGRTLNAQLEKRVQ